MRILVVCQYYYPEPFRVTDICENLVDKGHDVTVLTGLPNYPEGDVLEDYRHRKRRNEIINGVKVVRCFEIGRGNSKFKLFLNYLSYSISATIKALLLNDKFDVVLVNQLSPVMMGIPAIAYKKMNHKKILLYCLDLWPDSLAAGGIKEDSIIYKIFFKISKWIYSSADTILVTSGMFKNYFEDILGIHNVNIKHLPQYAEDLFIQKDDDNKTKVNTSIQDKKYNFVFAGNIGEMQSVDTIIKAAKELQMSSDIVFHVVGDGSRLVECKKLVDELGIMNVTFYGRQPLENMPKFYDMADAMLITLKDNKTVSYTLPGKIQTYMAARKPIIGAINGETRNVIEHSKCGLCSKAEDYRGLAEIILEFCASDEKEQMSENAQRYYLENFNKNTFLKVLEDELISLEA